MGGAALHVLTRSSLERMFDGMEVSRGGTPRPWPAPVAYQDMRPPGHRAVYIHLPDQLVTGELLKWLRSDEHGWYGYVTWVHDHVLHTEPVPADRIERYPWRPAA